MPDHDELLTPAEVARIFGVDPKTVARWAKTGRIPSIRTPGGHRRYRRADVDRILAGEHPATRTWDDNTPRDT